MTRTRLRLMQQTSRYNSPWTLGHRLRAALWSCVWLVLFRPTPKPFFAWRILLLRLFGCNVSGRPFVASSAIIKFPWQLTLEDRACIGPHAEVYNLGEVILREGCTISQHAYICGGTHDFESERMELLVGDIEIGRDAFIGAKAFVLPGVRIGQRAIVGACAVVTRDVAPESVVVGNPAKAVRQRPTPRAE